MELKRKSDTQRYIILEVSDDGSNAGRGNGDSWGSDFQYTSPWYLNNINMFVNMYIINKIKQHCHFYIENIQYIASNARNKIGQKSFTIETSFCKFKVIALYMVRNVIKINIFSYLLI